MKILLFDDHQLFAKSLELVLADKVESFKAYDNPDDILNIITQAQPDLVILDVHMGEHSGLEVGRKLRYHLPDLKIVFLSGYNLHEYNREARRMGACGFLEKNVSVDKLIDSLKRIHEGQTVFMGEETEDILEELTAREKEILQLASNGDTQQIIADTLEISRRTVNNHLVAINEKLMVSSTVAAVIKGIELGIVKLSNNR
ncbi:response regulator transcription factor [Erysipelothrix sp. HDW6C]|uniref:response regulator transcription factor n=1 Tax=Erysipelothrix sp. HDW6C TaxID=2714930 RepID=UPI00140DDD7E|nr:response regulator transcription factor [Erysipelothrix sp. HDW6C]QIK70775.1 response regulator transcription factor [Erysipelothrix sp. HDW6C]